CQPLYVVGSRAILITGARGLVGSHLCDAFADGGWEVRALDRPGTHRSPVPPKATYTEAELGSPEAALVTAELAKGTSIVAHAAFAGAGLHDEAPVLASAYVAAALTVAALAARSGRPLWVPRRGPVVHTVHAEDVARAALLVASEDPDSLDGKAFNVADDVPLPLEELARALLQAAGAEEAGRVPYSPAPARAFLWFLRRMPGWMFWGPLNRKLARAWISAWEGEPPGSPPALDPALLEQFSADRYYDTSRLRTLGFVPRYPSAVEGLLRLAVESRSHGLLPPPRGAPALPPAPEVDRAGPRAI